MIEKEVNMTAIDMGVAIIVSGLESNKVTILAPDETDDFKTKTIEILCDELNDVIIIDIEDEDIEYFEKDQFGDLSTREFFHVFTDLYLQNIKESTELIYEFRDNKYYLLEDN